MAAKPDETIYFGFERGEIWPITIKLESKPDIRTIAKCMKKSNGMVFFYGQKDVFHSETITLTAIVDEREFVGVYISEKDIVERFDAIKSSKESG